MNLDSTLTPMAAAAQPGGLVAFPRLSPAARPRYLVATRRRCPRTGIALPECSCRGCHEDQMAAHAPHLSG
jgi:hypothetical protein